MATRIDSIGNLRGLYPAALGDAPVLLFGSHIDTVPNAGRFDGILGVALALALLRSLGGRRLPYAIEVIAFSEEEGVRFCLPFIGSRALAGTLGAAEFARTDAASITLAEALTSFGLDPAADCAPLPRTFAFLEVHIEQGPVLDREELSLGIVTAIAGQSRLSLTFRGQANHAGTTPMRFRADALMAAVQWITAVEALARETPGLVATIGTLAVSPGAVNIIPGEVTCSLDIRHAEDKTRKHAVRRLCARAESIVQYRSLHAPVTVEITETSTQQSVRMDSALTLALEAAAQRTAQPCRTMPSGAGHDAMIVAAVLPSAMLFLRTPNGLSHLPDEAVRPDDVTAALTLLSSFLEHLPPNQR